MSSRQEKIADFLKENKGKNFTARELAEWIIQEYPDEFLKKRKQFNDEKSFINQVVSEIGAHKDKLAKLGITWNDHPSPRKFYYEENINNLYIDKNSEEDDAPEENNENYRNSIKEKDLYQPIINYLYTELNLYSLRIREVKSSNNLGKGANMWLHPDIVSMSPIYKDFNIEIQECLVGCGSPKVRLLSFEVKPEKLTLKNLRNYFFQTVSNSSWANEGYLIVTEIANDTENELRILSSLHGIGVIVYNIENPSESEIFLPSKNRQNINWHSINRLANENSDFYRYLENINAYIKTNKIHKDLWNKILDD